jgi:hypothetical protein
VLGQGKLGIILSQPLTGYVTDPKAHDDPSPNIT